MFILFELAPSWFFTITFGLILLGIAVLIAPLLIKTFLFDLPIYLVKNVWAFIKWYVRTTRSYIFGPTEQELQEAYEICREDFIREHPGEEIPFL